MRVLFSTTAGAGHFGPAIPVARACVAAGHEVRVASPESFGDHVRRAGFDHVGFPDVAPELLGAIFGRLPSLPHDEANRVVITEVFGRLDAQAALPALLELAHDWRPDVIVRDPAELGSMATAAKYGIPEVQVAIGLASAIDAFGAWLTEPLRELSDLAGLSVGPDARHLAQTPTLSCVPPSLDERPGAIEPSPVFRYGVATPPGEPALPADWGDPDLPLVYVSFGSVAGALGPFGGVYGRTLEVLADLPIRVLMTTGTGLDPTTLGPTPDNAHVVGWWPQENVMPEAALVIGHGGFGTTMTAVRAGVPQVVLPLFSSDQYLNAERIEAVGAGRRLTEGIASVPDLPAVVLELLADQRCRGVAQALATEAAGLPDVATTVDVLADLASSQQA